MFFLPIKLDRVSFETKGRQNLQKTADFVIESIVFCPLIPPSWISLVDPTSAMYASAIYVSYIYDFTRFFVTRHASNQRRPWGRGWKSTFEVTLRSCFLGSSFCSFC